MNATHRINIDRPMRPYSQRKMRLGFSITEMLVVVGIIVLLASLLMVAMGRVRDTAKASQTLSIMQNFAASCDAFQTDHGTYPGVIPETVLATSPAELVAVTVPGGGDGPATGPITFTSTENALLHMMGGYRVLPPGVSSGALYEDYQNYAAGANQTLYEIHFGTPPNQWQLKVNLNEIGQGPVINGRPYPAYYTPGANEVSVAAGQFNATDVEPGGWVRLPDLIDGWGQPILYMRQIRTTGPLVSDDPAARPQFLFGPANSNRRFGGMTGYLLAQSSSFSPGLGELGIDQTAGDSASILNRVPAADRLATFAQIIRHPAFGAPDEPLSPENVQRAAARGAYVLISAGKDGIFFSAQDGPGTPGNSVTNIVTGTHGDPRVVEQYDDIIFFGGG